MNARMLFGHIRRSGVRIHGGPWTVSGIQDAPARMIVALGRTAGPAVVRSRARRIARDLFRRRGGPCGKTSVLLMARGSVAEEPRRRLRSRLSGLFARLDQAIAKQMQEGGRAVE